MKRITITAAFLLFLCLSISAIADTVRVLAISKGRALVDINNYSQMTMTPGSEIDGIRLLNLKGTVANFSIHGDLHKISVGQMTIVSSSTFTTPRDPESNGIVIRKGNSARKIREISIAANRSGSYYINGTINNVPVRFHIDTGATTIAMSRAKGTEIGLLFEKGIPVIAATASGKIPAFAGSCQRVTVGEIELANVICSVSEKLDDGILNHEVLLGMSFLRRINMRQENGILTLSQVY